LYLHDLFTLNFAQFLEGMSEKIRMGIETAETDLSKEKEKKQQEEVRIFCINLTLHPVP